MYSCVLWTTAKKQVTLQITIVIAVRKWNKFDQWLHTQWSKKFIAFDMNDREGIIKDVWKKF